MVEERVTTIEPAQGRPEAIHTTIIQDDSGRRSGGSGWLIGLVILAALIAGVYFFSQISNTEAAKDNAVANAAGEVGTAAEQVGNAAQSAGEAARDATDDVTKN